MCIKVCRSCCDLCCWLYFSLVCLIQLFFLPQASLLSQSEENSDIGPEMADEFMHPHTHWILKQPVAKYVLDPHPVYLKHGRPTASSGAAAASGSPSGQSADASGQGTNTEADTATQHEASPTPSPPDYPPALLVLLCIRLSFSSHISPVPKAIGMMQSLVRLQNQAGWTRVGQSQPCLPSLGSLPVSQWRRLQAVSPTLRQVCTAVLHHCQLERTS